MAKTCACMSTKIPADVRADAAEALRRSGEGDDGHVQVDRSVDPAAQPDEGLAGDRGGSGRLHVTADRLEGAGQTLKELPQPQDEVAFGFFTWKDDPTISST